MTVLSEMLHQESPTCLDVRVLAHLPLPKSDSKSFVHPIQDRSWTNGVFLPSLGSPNDLCREPLGSRPAGERSS